jgi:hypothetical protein
MTGKAFECGDRLRVHPAEDSTTDRAERS